MLADCCWLTGGSASLPVDGIAELPAPGTVGCVAEVRVNQELPDGRSNIVVMGGSRFVLSACSTNPIPTLSRWFRPSTMIPVPSRAEDTPSCASFWTLFCQPARAQRRRRRRSRRFRKIPPSLSFQIAGGIECDLGVKQRLLAERSTARRVKALMLLLPVLTSAVEPAMRSPPARPHQRQGRSDPRHLAQ